MCCAGIICNPACARIVQALAISKLDYANSLLVGLPKCALRRLRVAQNSAARLVSRVSGRTRITPVLKHLHWLPVHLRAEYKLLSVVFSVLNTNTAPIYLRDLLKENNRRTLRSNSSAVKLDVARTIRKTGEGAFAVCASSRWNSLPAELRQCDSLASFKRQLKTHFFNDFFNVNNVSDDTGCWTHEHAWTFLILTVIFWSSSFLFFFILNASFLWYFCFFFRSLPLNCSARRNTCIPRFIRTTVIILPTERFAVLFMQLIERDLHAAGGRTSEFTSSPTVTWYMQSSRREFLMNCFSCPTTLELKTTGFRWRWLQWKRCAVTPANLLRDASPMTYCRVPGSCDAANWENNYTLTTNSWWLRIRLCVRLLDISQEN